MRATVSQFVPAQTGGPVRGTFLPDASGSGPGVHSVLPRVLAVVAGVVFMRTLARVARHHGGHGTRRERRMERLAQLHRDLHARDDGTAKSAEGVAA